MAKGGGWGAGLGGRGGGGSQMASQKCVPMAGARTPGAQLCRLVGPGAAFRGWILKAEWSDRSCLRIGGFRSMPGNAALGAGGAAPQAFVLTRAGGQTCGGVWDQAPGVLVWLGESWRTGTAEPTPVHVVRPVAHKMHRRDWGGRGGGGAPMTMSPKSFVCYPCCSAARHLLKVGPTLPGGGGYEGKKELV